MKHKRPTIKTWEMPNFSGVVVTRDGGIMSGEKFQIYNMVRKIEREKGIVKR